VTQAEYVRVKKVLFSKVGPEVLALNVDRGQCYGLNDTASAIWEMLDTPQSVPAICAAIEASYEVDPDECRIEVERLLGEMVKDELVSVSLVGAPED
jgi:hypothetical protein